MVAGADSGTAHRQMPVGMKGIADGVPSFMFYPKCLIYKGFFMDGTMFACDKNCQVMTRTGDNF